MPPEKKPKVLESVIEKPIKEFSEEDTTLFVSILDEPFTCRWNGRLYDFPARSKQYFRVPIAQHFAKHMANKLLQDLYDKEWKEKSPNERREDPHNKARAQLFLDPRRFELYKEMLPELAEIAGMAEKLAAIAVGKLPEPKATDLVK